MATSWTSQPDSRPGPSFSWWLAVLLPVGMGAVLLVGAVSMTISGDMGPSPVYHAGGLWLFGLLWLPAMFISLALRRGRLSNRALLILWVNYLGWALLGAGLMVAIEVFSHSACCANPTLRRAIWWISILWFVVPVLLPYGSKPSSPPPAAPNEP